MTVFFGSEQFSQAEFTVLSQLCSSQGTHAKVIVVGPANSPSLILQAIHCGATDFLDIQGDINVELRNLIGRLNASTGGSQVNGRLIAVAPTVGGAGTVRWRSISPPRSRRSSRLAACLTCGFEEETWPLLLKVKPRYTLLSLAEKAQAI